MRRRIFIFRQTIQIEETRVVPLPTKLVKYDGIEASICAIKAIAVHPRRCCLKTWRKITPLSSSRYPA